MADLLELARRAHPSGDWSRLTLGLELARELAAEPGGAALLGQGTVAARLLLEMRLDVDAITAAVLAPWVCEGGRLPTAVQERLPSELLALLDGVARLDGIHWHRLEGEAAETLRRMFLAMARDVRVVLIALAQRVELMRRSNTLPPEQAQRLSKEVLEVFAPLANRLGIWQFKSELEDAAFAALDPEHHRELSLLLNQRAVERQQYIDRAAGVLKQRLAREGLEALVVGRPKHIYSIWKKMQRKHISFEQVYDVSALRVITERTADCYAILGVVHSLWHPIKGEFDDYVAMPKSNGYQSLHTAVIGPEGRPVEVQIRTFAMHRFAEYGVAAHWAYKEQRSRPNLIEDRFSLLRRLLDWEQELKDPKQFVDSLKTDLFQDQVYVFTPEGDIVDLPAGATALDFAYRVHTQLGHRTRGARVNDQIVSLDRALSNGDRVEILTHKHPEPSRDWMNPQLGYLRTASARAKVRHWFREQERDQAVAAGREMVKKELARVELKHVKLEDIARALAFASLEDLYAAIGYGDKSSQLVASTALQLERAGTPEPEPALPQRKSSRRSTSGLSLHGVPDVLGNRARCCSPLPGDAVVGFVTRGRGIVIHRRDCANVHDSPEPERWVEVEWGPQGREGHAVQIEVLAHDGPALLGELTRLAGALGAKVVEARSEASSRGVRLRLSVETRSAGQLASLLQRLRGARDVQDVRLVS